MSKASSSSSKLLPTGESSVSPNSVSVNMGLDDSHGSPSADNIGGFGHRRRAGDMNGFYKSLDGRRRHNGWGSQGSGIAQYFGRLRKLPQMDFEFALWTMFYLCVNPRLVYRSVYYQKQTKNQWARDDPAFIVLFSVMLVVVAVAYGFAFTSGFMAKIYLILWMVGVDFVAVGVAVAAATWFVSNKYLLSHASYSSADQKVEYAYAWDVHCNSFFPLFLITYVLQFLFLPLINRDAWISQFLANSLYLIAISTYVWITYLGFSGKVFTLFSKLRISASFPV